jgi:hypothetical protein
MGHDTLTRSALDNAALERLNDADALKVLVTLDENGVPHPTPKGSIHWNGEHIVSWEILESSHSNRNLTRSIWFDKPVTILLVTADKQAYKIAAKTARNIVAGKEFTRHYEEAEKRHGRGIAGVWLYDPVEITDQSARTRIAEEQAAHPYFTHLDQLAKKD